MKNTYIKLFIGVALFATLVALTVLQVPNADRLIDLIYAALVGLGIYHLNTPSDAPPADKQGGGALPGLLAMIGLGSVLALAGCASTGQVTPTQTTQVTYTQACAAWGAAFATALDLRRAGKLNKAQVDQVTLLDSQITPICTGPLPADPTAATQQVTAAVTSMAIFEAVNKEK